MKVWRTAFPCPAFGAKYSRLVLNFTCLVLKCLKRYMKLRLGLSKCGIQGFKNVWTIKTSCRWIYDVFWTFVLSGFVTTELISTRVTSHYLVPTLTILCHICSVMRSHFYRRENRSALCQLWVSAHFSRFLFKILVITDFAILEFLNSKLLDFVILILCVRQRLIEKHSY